MAEGTESRVNGGRRVVVIGGGVVGVSAAYYLAGAGFRVTLVEKGEICAGSSYGNSGLIVPSHVVPLAAPGTWLRALRWMLDPERPFYIRPRIDPRLVAWLWRFRGFCTLAHARRSMPLLRDMTDRSLALYRELAKQYPFGFEEAGVLQAFRTTERFRAAVEETHLLGEVGVATKVLDGAEARQLEPSLQPEVVGAVFFPEDAHLIPDAFVKGLARLAAERGVELRTGAEVLGFRRAGRRLSAVETTRGDLETDLVVLAAGSWSPGVARTLGLHLPIEPAKGYSVTWRRPPAGPQIPVMMGEARAVITPMGDTIRFGGTLELAGLDLVVNRRRVAALVRAAPRYVRGIEGLPLVEVWRGLRPCTPDGLPMVGRPGRLDNLILATGHAMVGMSLGPITGLLVAQIAAGESPAVDVGLLAPDRFA